MLKLCNCSMELLMCQVCLQVEDAVKTVAAEHVFAWKDDGIIEPTGTDGTEPREEIIKRFRDGERF